MMAAAAEGGIPPATMILNNGPHGSPTNFGTTHRYEYDINTVGSPQSGANLSANQFIYQISSSYDVDNQAAIFDEVNDRIICTHTQRDYFVHYWVTNADPTAFGSGAGTYIDTGTASWNKHAVQNHSGNPIYKTAGCLYTCGTNLAYNQYVNRIYYHNYVTNSSTYINKNTSGPTTGFVIDEDRGLMFHSVSPTSGNDQLEVYTLNSSTGAPTFSSSSYTNSWGNAPTTQSYHIVARGYDPKRQVLYVGVQVNAAGTSLNDNRYGYIWALDVSTPTSPVVIGEYTPNATNMAYGRGNWFYDPNTDRIVIGWYRGNTSPPRAYTTCLDCSQVSTNGTVASMNYVGFFLQGNDSSMGDNHHSHFAGDSVCFISWSASQLYYTDISGGGYGTVTVPTDTNNVNPSPDQSNYVQSYMPLRLAGYTP